MAAKECVRVTALAAPMVRSDRRPPALVSVFAVN